MKPKQFLTTLILPLVTSVTVQAEVIYSNLQDIAIPQNINGVYLNVITGNSSGSEFSGWHVNPFFGGTAFANSPDFQPLRETSAGDGTISNISIGALVGSSSQFYASGFGGSSNHMGNTFTAGQEGYIGFSVINDSTTNYGWMRVIFDGDGDAFIRDWAYDASGGAISVGGIRQVGQDILLSAPMTVASNLANSGGATNLVMNHAGLTSLTGTNTHTGETLITQGTLSIDGGGSINNSSLTIDGGTLRYNSSVDYSGSITFDSGTIGGTNLQGALDNLTIGSGQILSPGNSIGTTHTGSQTWAGWGTYQWEINDATGSAGSDPGWDVIIGTGTLTITATDESPFIIAIESLGIIGDEMDAANFDEFNSYTWLIAEFNEITGFDESRFAIDASGFTNTFSGAFAITLGNTVDGGHDGQIYLTYTAIPEPRVALLAVAGLAVLFRRRRALKA